MRMSWKARTICWSRLRYDWKTLLTGLILIHILSFLERMFRKFLRMFRTQRKNVKKTGVSCKRSFHKFGKIGRIFTI